MQNTCFPAYHPTRILIVKYMWTFPSDFSKVKECISKRIYVDTDTSI